MTTEPFLTPELTESFLRTLKNLVGHLSTDVSRAINVPAYCERNGVDPDFFDALRDMEGLVIDPIRSTKAATYFFRTNKLLKIKPVDVFAQIQRNKADGRPATGSYQPDPEEVAGEVPFPQAAGEKPAGVEKQPVKRGRPARSKTVSKSVTNTVSEGTGSASHMVVELAITDGNQMRSQPAAVEAEQIYQQVAAFAKGSVPSPEPVLADDEFEVFNLATLPIRKDVSGMAAVTFSEKVVRFTIAARERLGLKDGSTVQFLRHKSGSWYIEVNPSQNGFAIRTKGRDSQVVFGHSGLCERMRSAFGQVKAFSIPIGDHVCPGRYLLLTKKIHSKK